MKNLVLWFFAGLLSLGTTAQTGDPELKQRYDSLAIFQFSESGFSLNGVKLKRKQLRTMLLSYPESAAEFKAFKRKQLLSNTLFIGAGVAYLTSLFILPENFELAAGMAGAAIVTEVAGIPASVKARRHLQRAVWMYNRSVLSGDQRIVVN